MSWTASYRGRADGAAVAIGQQLANYRPHMGNPVECSLLGHAESLINAVAANNPPDAVLGISAHGSCSTQADGKAALQTLGITISAAPASAL